ncbi:MAG: SDR family NAD(P)-dependent oxidoreductase [Armatimonadota bacterium]
MHRHILVTGSSGIAAAAIRTAVINGIAVTFVGVNATEVAELSSETGAIGLVCDLRDEHAVEKVFTGLSGITDVIHVAGGSGRSFGDGPLTDVTLKAWQQTFDLNLTTAFLVTREAIRMFERHNIRGSITLTGTALAFHPEADRFATAAYMASKSAFVGLVNHTASKYAEVGIRINAVLPGLTRTPMSLRAQENPEICAFVKRRQPLTNGFVEADAIADALLFFASDAAASITGQQLAVDGGWSLGGLQHDPQ